MEVKVRSTLKRVRMTMRGWRFGHRVSTGIGNNSNARPLAAQDGTPTCCERDATLKQATGRQHNHTEPMPVEH